MRRWGWVLVSVLLSLSMADAAWYIGPPAGSTVAGSAACSDSADGSRATPFCTFERARTAAAGADKTIYLRGQPTTGFTTYTRTASYTPGNGEIWSTDPQDQRRSARINFTGITGTAFGTGGFAVFNRNGFTIKNFTLVGPLNVCADSGIVAGGAGTSNIHIEDNQFNSNHPSCQYQSDVWIHHGANDIYIQGNKFTMTSPWGVSIRINTNNGGTYQNFYITDNIWDNGCYPFCIEWFDNDTQTIGNHYHIDRNKFQNIQIACGSCGSCPGTHSPVALSYAHKGANLTNSTIWGNEFSQPTNAFQATAGIELISGDGGNVTVSNNTFIWMARGLVINVATGAVIENNNFTLRTSGFSCIAPNCGGAACAYADEEDPPGGTPYSATEWYGTNTYNGTDHTGCTVVGSPNFCVMAPHSQGAKPAVWSPSAPFVVGPTFDLTGPSSVTSGTAPTLTWTAVTGATSCTPSMVVGTDANWTGATLSLSGGNVTGTTMTTARTYRMQCTDGTNIVNDDVAIAVAGSPPPAPGSFTASSPTVSTASHTWTASIDPDGDLAGYRLYTCRTAVDGASCAPNNLAMTFGTSPLNGLSRGLLGNTAYRMALRAFDAAANESANSNIVALATAAIPAGNPELQLSFEVGSGTVVFDGSGHGHNSSSFTGTYGTPPHDGSFAASFNGTQSARIPRTFTGETPIGLEPAAVTIAGWFRRSGTQVSFTNLLNKTWGNNTGPTFTSYKLLLNPGGTGSDVARCEIGISGGVNGVSSPAAPGPVADLTWTHIACTYDPAGTAPQLNLYVNGALSGTPLTQTAAILYDTSDLYLSENGAGGERFTGLMDDVRIYRRALTASEIAALADTTAPTAPTTVSLSATTSTSLSLAFSGATDNVVVTDYELWQCADAPGATSCSPTVLGLLGTTTSPVTLTGRVSNTSYGVQLKAVDGAGNRSPLSTPVQYVTTPASSVAGPIDNFNVDPLNLAVWELNTLTSTVNTGVTVVQTGGQLVLTPLTNTAGINYRGIRSVATADLTDKCVLAEIVQRAGGGNANTVLAVVLDSSNWVRMVAENFLLYSQTFIGSMTSNGTPVTYNAANHRWWRICHQSSDNTVRFFTSIASPITWVEQRNVSWAGSFAITAVDVGVEVGTFEATATPGVMIVDNFNVSGADTTPPLPPTNLRVVSP